MQEPDIGRRLVRLELVELLMLAWLALGLAYLGHRVLRVEAQVRTLSAPAGQLIYDVRAEAWVCNGCDPDLFREALGYPRRDDVTHDSDTGTQPLP